LRAVVALLLLLLLLGKEREREKNKGQVKVPIFVPLRLVDTPRFFLTRDSCKKGIKKTKSDRKEMQERAPRLFLKTDRGELRA